MTELELSSLIIRKMCIYKMCIPMHFFSESAYYDAVYEENI